MTYKGKVLLCEDGDRGHRPTIQRYVQRALRENGIDYELTKLSQGDVSVVYELAKERECTGVHFLTVDGAAKQWLRRWIPISSRVPALGTYYLFSNAHQYIKGMGLGFACRFSGVEALLVSDDFLAERVRLPFGPNLEFLPDPWLRDEFLPVSQGLARDRLGFDSAASIFMMFGELSARKGFDVFLEALAVGPLPEDFVAICAGRIDVSIFRTHGKILSNLVNQGRLKCIDRYIEEEEVSAFFHASDFVVCPYPRYFKVSSNTATRAMAAGRPYITFNHGVIATTAERAGCGIVVQGWGGENLYVSMIEACATLRRPAYTEMGRRGLYSAQQREFRTYSDKIISLYLKYHLISI